MATINLDGRRVRFAPGETLMEVARANGASIPTLCHHPGLDRHGGCRLCVVEISRPGWDGWRRVVTSCEYLAEPDLLVFTSSDRIERIRRTIMGLLLARCPSTEFVAKKARELGVERTAFAPRETPDDCILCGLCVRACKAVGAEAIAPAGRGVEKQVGPPYAPPGFERPPEVTPAEDCVGCLSCAHVCPTAHISYEDDGRERSIWGRSFAVVPCSCCGAPIGTREQLDHFAKKSGLPENYFERCDTCRKEDTARAFSRVMG